MKMRTELNEIKTMMNEYTEIDNSNKYTATNLSVCVCSSEY